MFLALLGLIWQNLHPSLPIGILVYGLLSLQDFDKERALSWFWEVGAGVGVLAICCVLTPDGFELLRVSQDSQRISTALGVSEWLPAWSLGVRAAMTPFYFFFVLGVIALLVKRKDYKLSEVSFFVLFSAMTFYAARFGFYLGLVAVPFFVKTVEQITPKNLFAWNPNAPVRKIQFIIPGLIYLTLIGGMALYLPMVSPIFPREAIAALKNHPEVRRVFDYREYAGALSYWGDKHWKLFIDGRLYLYPEKIWRFYNGVAVADEHSLEILCREYRPDVLFLRKSFFAGFLSQFETSENELCERKWNNIYEDDETIVFILDHDKKISR
jgi:hypothetical protein